MNAYTLEVNIKGANNTYVVIAKSSRQAQAQLWDYLSPQKLVNKPTLQEAITNAQIEQLDLSCPGVAFEHRGSTSFHATKLGD